MTDLLELPEPFMIEGHVFSAYYDSNLMRGVEEWIVDKGILSEEELNASRSEISEDDLRLIYDNGEHPDIIALVRGMGEGELNLFGEEGLSLRGFWLSGRGKVELANHYRRWKNDEDYFGNSRNGRLGLEARAYFVLANRDNEGMFVSSREEMALAG